MGKTPDAFAATAWFTRPTGRLRIEAPQAFGTGKGMAFAGVLRRAWIPLVVLAVIGGAGFTVSRVRAVSDSDKHSPYGQSEVADIGQLAQKSVVYRGLRSGGHGGGHQLF